MTGSASEAGIAESEFRAPHPENTDTLPAVDVSNRRALTIALLLPPDGSPLISAAQIVGNGLIAASRSSARPASVLTIASDENTSVSEQLEAAALSGADVVVGPLRRDRVLALADMTELPLPVVALNTIPERGATSPDNLIMMSVATETEAEYVARLCVASLPEFNERNEPPKVAILTSEGAWQERLRFAYEHVLQSTLTPYDVHFVSGETLADLSRQLEAKLTLEEESLYAERIAAIEAEEADTPAEKRRKKSRIRNVESERRALVATSEPPYAAALLALDAQTAGIIRTSIPQRTRIWATSTANPGDPRTSSSSTALAFDLENLAFVDAPLTTRYDAQSFEGRFGSPMPYSLASKRLFALGVDAYEIAQQWASRRPVIQYHGETGTLELNRKTSAVVGRTPQAVVVKSGVLIEVSAETLAVKGAMPRIRVPKPVPAPAPLWEPDRMVSSPDRPSVTTIILPEGEDEQLRPPSPPVPPLPRSSAPTATDAIQEALPIKESASETAPEDRSDGLGSDSSAEPLYDGVIETFPAPL